MTQQTLVVLTKEKCETVLKQIKQNKQLAVVCEKKFTLTVKSSSDIFKKQINKTQFMHGFVLEGTNATKAMLDIIEPLKVSCFVHTSQDPFELNWFKKKAGATTSNSSSKKQQPIKKELLNVSNTQLRKTPSSLRSTNALENQQLQKPPILSSSSSLSSSKTKKTVKALKKGTARKITSETNIMSTTRSKIPSSKVLSDTNKKPNSTSSNMTRLSVTSKKTSSLNVTSAANSNSAIRPSPSASKRAAAAKKALTNTAKGGISKNTPPVSVLTGKTRKSSRLTSSTAPIAEKKKTVKKKFEPKPSTKESALPISTARSSGTTLSAKEKTTKEQVAKEKIMNSKPLKERLSEDKPVTEEPAVEEPTTMEPVTEELVTEELVTEELVTEELVTEELVIEEPVMQEQAKELQTSSPQQTDNQEQEKENELPAEELPLTKAEESGITERIEKNQVMYCISSDVTTQEESIAASHQEEKEVNPQHSISHVSTGSSVATADEHDAEVAATTIRARVQQKQQELPHIQSGRSSFSPNSVVSLPRPETPEVDQLRLRFENIIQTSTPSSVDIVRRRSSPKIAPEIAYRIKDMKPRGPVGSRVKSMVELFMDENLNKWEF